MTKTILAVLLLCASALSFADVPTLLSFPALKSEAEYTSDAQTICYDKWNKRGELDQRMYRHCIEQQKDGYDELKHLHQYANQSFYSEISFPHCRDKWTKRGVSDTRMMAHCLNQEIEGIKDVMYYREKYSEDTVNQIAGQAISRFNSWSMAAYRVKQHFE